jgi:uncharacterized protein (TIGR00369 family)
MGAAEDYRAMKSLPDGILPWTRSCLVCGQDNPRGFRLRSRLERGIVVLDYTCTEQDVGYLHAVHGGAVMTLLDEVMTWAAILTARRMAVLAEMTSRYRQSIPAGTAIRAEAWPERDGRRLVIAAGRIVSADRVTVFAEATGKYMPAALDAVSLQHSDFVESPEALDLARLLA